MSSETRIRDAMIVPQSEFIWMGHRNFFFLIQNFSYVEITGREWKGENMGHRNRLVEQLQIL